MPTTTVIPLNCECCDQSGSGSGSGGPCPDDECLHEQDWDKDAKPACIGGGCSEFIGLNYLTPCLFPDGWGPNVDYQVMEIVAANYNSHTLYCNFEGALVGKIGEALHFSVIEYVENGQGTDPEDFPPKILACQWCRECLPQPSPEYCRYDPVSTEVLCSAYYNYQAVRVDYEYMGCSDWQGNM